MDKKYLSSSETGYIILAKLKEGPYQLAIGSPKNELAELNVTLSVKDVNAGYLLRKSSAKSWSLVNLQTSSSITVEKSTVADKQEEDMMVGNEFAKILAEVVNDSSIAKIVTPKRNPETVITTEKIVKKVPTVVIDQEIVSSEIPPEKKIDAKIVKLMNDSTSGGLLFTYLDKYDVGNDTVKIFLPVDRSKAVEQKENDAVTKKDSRSVEIELPTPNAKPDSAVLKEGEQAATEKKVASAVIEKTEIKPAVTDTVSKAVINVSCKKTATQNDFLQLRRQMAGEDNERNMTKTAAKKFALLCFTTDQVRNLGLMYVTEDERYKFFVAAFQHVEDVQNFAILEQQLADIYYKTRFKAMLNR